MAECVVVRAVSEAVTLDRQSFRRHRLPGKRQYHDRHHKALSHQKECLHVQHNEILKEQFTSNWRVEMVQVVPWHNLMDPLIMATLQVVLLMFNTLGMLSVVLEKMTSLVIQTFTEHGHQNQLSSWTLVLDHRSYYHHHRLIYLH